MKRRLPLMLNDAPSASKSRKTMSSMEIQSLADSEYDDDDDDDDYVNLMGNLEQPIVYHQAKMVPASSSTRGMISEIPNTPSSTRSHHDDLEDIDDIIEEVGATYNYPVDNPFSNSSISSTGSARGGRE